MWKGTEWNWKKEERNIRKKTTDKKSSSAAAIKRYLFTFFSTLSPKARGGCMMGQECGRIHTYIFTYIQWIVSRSKHKNVSYGDDGWRRILKKTSQIIYCFCCTTLYDTRHHTRNSLSFTLIFLFFFFFLSLLCKLLLIS